MSTELTDELVDELTAGIITGQINDRLTDVKRGLLVLPRLRAYFAEGNVPVVNFRLPDEHPLDRVAGDGWFHPSTHPGWSERALVHYLRHPQRLILEPSDYMRTLSMTFGTMLHKLVGAALGEIELLPPRLQVCTTCPPDRPLHEPGFVDPELRERGHTDGILDLPDEDLWELKSAGDGTARMLAKMTDLDEDAFRLRWPYYYDQGQRYMAMSGRDRVIAVLFSLGYPWTMREFHLHRNPERIAEISAKYRRVVQAVADQDYLECECNQDTSKQCPARALCGVWR